LEDRCVGNQAAQLFKICYGLNMQRKVRDLRQRYCPIIMAAPLCLKWPWRRFFGRDVFE
jgi:hypothetical protein